MNKRYLSLCLILLCCALTAGAKVVLPPVISDNMVLQQNTDAALWGKAEPGKKVTIIPSWAKAKTVVIAGEDGSWSARVSTPAAGGPYEITFVGAEKVTLKNILIGEVWICSGQSNMEMPVKGFKGQPVDGSADLILGAKPSVPIRTCNLQRVKALTPQDECACSWGENTPENVANASATAYFFAKKLHEVLDIPVGVINVSWGGTPIEAWMKKELISGEFGNEFDLSFYDKGEFREKNPHKAPGVLYNGMHHSVIPFTAKGFIWYQGCDNRTRFEQYKRLQPAFVKMLREDWGNEDMPFYFTQIAPYRYDDPESPVGGYMMWAQAQTLDLIPHSGMATTHDVGSFACIHPADKESVGNRLAYQALVNDYGLKGVDAFPPVFSEAEFKDGKATVSFTNPGAMGLSPINVELGGFELAGEDKVFHPAKAKVLGDKMKIQVWSSEVPEPVAVRYGMKNWSVATLFNTFGIPASPFRSDDWE